MTLSKPTADGGKPDPQNQEHRGPPVLLLLEGCLALLLPLTTVSFYHLPHSIPCCGNTAGRVDRSLFSERLLRNALVVGLSARTAQGGAGPPGRTAEALTPSSTQASWQEQFSYLASCLQPGTALVPIEIQCPARIPAPCTLL